jgi:uncharacterized peroxidase-related enzyme
VTEPATTQEKDAMPFIATIAPEEAQEDLRAMYQRQQDAWGFIPNYAKVFSHRPEVLARWGRLLAEIKRPMDKRRFELVTFVAAYELRNSACALAHGKALAQFYPPETVRAIAEDRAGEALSEADQAVLRFTRQIVKDASRVTSGLVGQLKVHGFSDAEIFDIAVTAAGRAFFTKLLDALGAEPDSSFLELDESFRAPLTVGRPIDCRPCTRTGSVDSRRAAAVSGLPESPAAPAGRPARANNGSAAT